MLSYVMTRAADKLLRLYRPTAETIRNDPRWYTQPSPRAVAFSDVRRILRGVSRVERLLRDAIRRNDGNVTLLDDVTREPF